jgi:phosphotransferase system enzyme I (PtsI)
MRLTGTPVSPGFATGPACTVVAQDLTIPHYTVPQADRGAEMARLETALSTTTKELQAVKDTLRGKVEEDLLALFDAHAIILDDPALKKAARDQIFGEGLNAEYALQKAVQAVVAALLASGDTYFQERALDLEDLHARVQGHLEGRAPEFAVPEGGERVILANNLTPSETGNLHQASVVAFATEHGARTSHTAIIARSLEIPAVVGVHGLMAAARMDQTVIVDGVNGVVILDPSPEEEADYAAKATAYREYRARIQKEARLEARTVDGVVLRVRANIDLVDEIPTAVASGAEGVGLYRSEFLYLQCSPALPTEEQHAELYTRLCTAMFPHRVVIRTLDLGGEKYFHKVLEPEGKNPVLGVRAVRFTLRHPELFKPQLRGLLRASVRKNLAVMFPLITTVDELKQCLTLLETCRAELVAEGVPYDPELPVGIMVEVPCCALTAEAFAPLVDFFSIGTNDLIQYLMAIDRNNESVAGLYDPMNPAVLRCIAHVCEAGRAHGLKVSVCGEVASDPSFIPLLLGLGVTELSMAPAALLEVKSAVRHLTYEKCRRMARRALKAHTGAEVAEILRGHDRAPRRSGRQG